MYRPLEAERPEIRSQVSQTIVALTLELMALEPQLVCFERLLERKAEIIRRIEFLRSLELEYEGSI